MNNIHIDSSLCAPMWLARLKLSLLLSKKDTYAGNPLSLSWGKRPLVLVEMTWFKAGKNLGEAIRGGHVKCAILISYWRRLCQKHSANSVHEVTQWQQQNKIVSNNNEPG